jgi:hypothetical protein
MRVSWASAAIGGKLCGKFRQVEMKFHDFTFPGAHSHTAPDSDGNSEAPISDPARF